MPSDRLLRLMNAFHRLVLQVTRGRVGWNAGGMPVLDLTTTGRRSGEQRSIMLTSPVRDGDSYVIVASKGGDRKHPAWFLNLRENPRVEVVVHGRPKQEMVARIATPADRARLWPQIIAAYPNYGRYQKRTDREIPIILLDPLA